MTTDGILAMFKRRGARRSEGKSCLARSFFPEKGGSRYVSHERRPTSQLASGIVKFMAMVFGPGEILLIQQTSKIYNQVGIFNDKH
jgi:hypothetical protein